MNNDSHPPPPPWPRPPCSTALGCVAGADEAEIFVGTGNTVSNERPNILFIIDTSGSMDTNVVTQVPFNPATDWPGSCADDRVYFRQGSNSSNPPACNDNNSVPLAAFKCNAALTNMALAGYYVADRAAQWRTNRWRGINGSTGNSVWVECRTDAGVHGNGVSTSALWAADGNNGPWSANCGQAIAWNPNGANERLRVLLRQLHQLAEQRQHDHADAPRDRAAGGDPDRSTARGRRRGQRRPDAVQQQHQQRLRQHRHLRGRHGAARHGPGRCQPRRTWSATSRRSTPTAARRSPSRCTRPTST